MKYGLIKIAETEEEWEQLKQEKWWRGDTESNQANVCSKCDEKVTPKVEKYSQDKYGKVLCYNCQQKEES